MKHGVNEWDGEVPAQEGKATPGVSEAGRAGQELVHDATKLGMSTSCELATESTIRTPVHGHLSSTSQAGISMAALQMHNIRTQTPDCWRPRVSRMLADEYR